MEKTERIWLDGELVAVGRGARSRPDAHAALRARRVRGHPLLRSDTTVGSAIFRLREHIDRLFDSAHILGHEDAVHAQTRSTQACIETVRANGLRECYLRPIVFLGDGAMGLGGATADRALRSRRGTGARTSATRACSRASARRRRSFARFHANTLMTKAKTVGHYVNSILAKREARGCGYDEALLLDVDGYVAEASGENIFIVTRRRGEDAAAADRPGRHHPRHRARLLADLGVPTREERFTRDELYLADEAFFTGTAAEITPVRELDDRTHRQREAGPDHAALAGAVLPRGGRARGPLPELGDAGVFDPRRVAVPRGVR